MDSKGLFDLTGKVGLVTGSSRGIGFALARGLAQAGCTVVLNGTREENLRDAVNRLKSESFRVEGVSFDVRDERVINERVTQIENDFGSVDILVNNAGVQARGPLEDFSLSDWQRIMDINLTGAFLVSKAVVKGMISRSSGKIINICSIQSELARPTIAAYTASKGGLRNLTKAMATEWGKYSIQVNGIAPGYIKTDMTKALYEDEKFDAWLRSRTPARRWGEPEDLVGTLVYLASEASSYVNGQIIYVDGGMLACV